MRNTGQRMDRRLDDGRGSSGALEEQDRAGASVDEEDIGISKVVEFAIYESQNRGD